MILAMINIFPLPGESKEVIDVFHSIKGPVEALSGCIECSVMVDQDDRAVCYIEKWQERSAFDRHLSSDLFKRILEIMEHSSIKPNVEFYEINGIGGLEIVEKVRHAKTAQ
jgi:quinol monooxygenase YgiN